MRIISVGLLAALLISISAHAAQPDAIRSAQQLLERGDTDMALSIVDNAVVANPDDRPARLMRGVILAKAGRSNEAIDAFSAFARDYPTLPEGHNNLAVLYSNMGDYDKARIELESALRANPNYAPGWANLAEVYLIIAGQSFSKSLQLDKQNAQMMPKISAISEMAGKVAAVPSKAPPMRTAQNCTAEGSDYTDPHAAKTTVMAVNKPDGLPVVADDRPMRFEVLTTVEAPIVPLAADKDPIASAAQDKTDAVAAVQRWANLWSKKAFREYLAMYSPSFQLPEGATRRQWENQRSARVKYTDEIVVGSFTSIEMAKDGSVVVSFPQRYKSGAIDARTQKRLTLVKMGGDWRIQNEELVDSAAMKSL